MILNVVYTIADTLIAGFGIAIFGFGAYHFERWWILLFCIVPLALFNAHSAIIDADIQEAKLNELKPQKGGEKDS